MEPNQTTLQFSVNINAPIEKVFDFHCDTTNLQKISPPNIKVSFRVSGPDGVGKTVNLRVVQFGFLVTNWVVRFTDYEPHRLLCDEQIKGPFAVWKQRREFDENRDGTTLTDTVVYKLPLGLLGKIADRVFVRKIVESMFVNRQRATKEILESSSAL